jgi:hypothetical protein
MNGNLRTPTGLLACVLALLACPALAQKAYRCGAVYQDRPCAAAQDGQAVNTSGAGQAAKADTRVDAECARRGQAALRVAWARESGSTEAEQSAQLRGLDREVLPEVYRLRGSSAEIRRAVEADCMAAKERELAPTAQPPQRAQEPVPPAAPTADKRGPTKPELTKEKAR